MPTKLSNVISFQLKYDFCFLFVCIKLSSLLSFSLHRYSLLTKFAIKDAQLKHFMYANVILLSSIARSMLLVIQEFVQVNANLMVSLLIVDLKLKGLSIGIIIGVFVLLLCCIIGCIYCCSRKNNIVYVSPQTVIHSTPIHPIDTVSTPLLNK